MKKSTYQVRYEQNEFPECYVPCAPFYDICNHGVAILCASDIKYDNQYHTCKACFDKFGFTDSIE